MIIGKIGKGEKTARISVRLECTSCGRQVPGGIKVAAGSVGTAGLEDQLRRLRSGYLCGACRDRGRVAAARRG